MAAQDKDRAVDPIDSNRAANCCPSPGGNRTHAGSFGQSPDSVARSRYLRPALRTAANVETMTIGKLGMNDRPRRKEGDVRYASTR